MVRQRGSGWQVGDSAHRIQVDWLAVAILLLRCQPAVTDGRSVPHTVLSITVTTQTFSRLEVICHCVIPVGSVREAVRQQASVHRVTGSIVFVCFRKKKCLGATQEITKGGNA